MLAHLFARQKYRLVIKLYKNAIYLLQKSGNVLIFNAKIICSCTKAIQGICTYPKRT